jgi:hypothetical protein
MEIKERKVSVNLSQEEENLMNKMIGFTQEFIKLTNCHSYSNYDCDSCPLYLFCDNNIKGIKEELESFLINSEIR